MKYLRTHSANTIGIFRKSGSKNRMSLLREIIEKYNSCNFQEFEKLINMTYNSVLATAKSDSSASSNKSNFVTNCTNNSNINQVQSQNIDLNSIGSGFSSQSTSKSDLIEDLNSSNTSSAISMDTIAIDVADVLKQYFRELPECLFTNKLSQTLIDIFMYLPENERLEAVQYCMLLLDDESRDVLQCLLYFLHDISQNFQVHKV